VFNYRSNPNLTDRRQEYTIYSDMSKHGLGCVLMHEEKVVAYAS